MKAIKLTLILLVFVVAAAACLAILGILPSEVAWDYGARAGGVILVLGLATTFALNLAGGGKSSQSDASKPGPKF